MAIPAQLKTISGRFIFLLRLLFALFGLAVSAAIAHAAITLEVESMSPVGSGATVSTSNDSNASGGVVEFLNATGANQIMTLTTPSVAAGTYQVQFRYKTNTTRGQHTVKIDGVQFGGTIDQYATTSAYVTATLGNVTFSTTATHTIVLSVTGKNTSATQYYITADVFTLTLQTSPPSAPVFSPVAGTYTSAQSVTVSSTGATSIYYTTNGSTPTTSSTLYSGAISIAASETLEAIGVNSGGSSAVTSGLYTINLPPAAAPTFSPVAGAYTSAQTVTITSTTSGASIRYTTDGVTVPTETVGTLYSGAVPINATTTLKAIAYKSGMADSTVTSGLYTISLPVATAPVFSPVAGTYTSAQTVTITSTTSGASIRYTTDGSTPSETNGTHYSSGVPINATTTLKAIAYASGLADSAVTSGTYTINLPVAATPTFSPIAGTYTSAQTVTIASTTSGALIRYTTDGVTAPTETVGTLYSGAVTISSTTTLKAIAYKAGDTDSTVTSGLYTISLPTAAAPTFSPAAGTYTVVKTVTITSTTSSASIRYTTDGSAPTETNGTLYSGAVTIGSTTTLKAIAYKSGMTDSSVTSGLYTINLPKVATPTFSPAAGTYTSVQSVTITSSTSGTTIRYTTDGSMPSETNGTVYSGTKVAINVTTTLKAIAYKAGMADSSVASGTYTLNLPKAATPTFSPGAGTYTAAQSVAISTSTSGATIRYTTDGSTPSETNGTIYSGTKVAINVTTTLKAIAYKVGNADSSVASGTYTINLPPSTPSFSPGGGTFTTAQSVSITSSGATSIYYTTNGTTPTTSSTLYSGSISISNNTNLQAISVNSAGQSPVASANYTILPPAPTFSPTPGTYANVTTFPVTISDALSANIYYTTDGSSPTTTSTLYTAPVSLPLGTTPLRAIAANTNGSSSVTSGTYLLTPPPPATPAFSPGGGTFTSAQSVTVTSSGASAIYYTTDGSTPTTSSTLYAGSISIPATTTLTAMGVNSGGSSAIFSATYTISLSPPPSAPAFTPVAGTYTNAQSVAIVSTGADSIYYTSDGSTPTTASARYNGPILISSTATLKAIGLNSGGSSPVSSAAYTLNLAPPAAPIFSPAAGTYTSVQSITITSSNAASIYYTTDGSTPTTASTRYNGSVTISAPTTLQAIGVNSGGSGPIASGIYTINLPPPAVPVLSPSGGTYTSAQTVGITSSGAAAIYYTTDGTTPSASSTLYSGPITVQTNLTLWAVGVNSGGSSAVVSATYTFNFPVAPTPAPVFSLAGGTYTSPQSVTITNMDEFGTVYYTTDGSTPSNASPYISGFSSSIPITGHTTTLQAICQAENEVYSTVTSASYIINGQVATPTFSPSAGTYTKAESILIRTTTAGATIRYTTDGSTPTETNGTVFSAAASVGSTTTLKAMAYESGMSDSAVATTKYHHQSSDCDRTDLQPGRRYLCQRAVGDNQHHFEHCQYLLHDGRQHANGNQRPAL